MARRTSRQSAPGQISIDGSGLTTEGCMAAFRSLLALRTAFRAAALAAGILFAASAAHARCGDAPGDAAAVAATRAQVQAQCSCASAVKHSDYVKCARQVAQAAVATGALAPSCQSSVQKCASRSTCGRSGAVTCCVTNRSGKTSCQVKRNAGACRAPSGGRACVGNFSSCCDACTLTGCAPLPTPTPSPTPPPTPVPTATPTPSPSPTPPDFCQALVGLPPIAEAPLTTTAGTSDCGGAQGNPPPAPPLSGRIDDGSGTKLADIGAGCLLTGALPPQMLIPGGVAKLAVVGIGLPTIVLGGSPGDGPQNCTKGAGPGRHCLNGGAGTDGNGACSSDDDCGTGAVGSCQLDGNCFFGPPVPVPNDFLSACAVNAFLTDLCGSVNLLNQQATFATTISARVYLTSNPTSPCPTCEGGLCTAGKRTGLDCTPIGPANTSNDCPPLDTQYIGALVVPIPQLTTGTSTLTADAQG